MRDNFWQDLPLEELTPDEWEALCDGCNLCCHRRTYNVNTGRVYYKGTFCIMLNPLQPRGCGDYANRAATIPECQPLTMQQLEDPGWLPETCSYRLRAQGLPLPDHHPLRRAASV
jgi:uncharacterized cysteine cluster protein YcgN (CxxCxxCC family)